MLADEILVIEQQFVKAGACNSDKASLVFV